MVTAVLAVLPHIVDAALLTPIPCLGEKGLDELMDPQRASPAALREMERKAGGSALHL